MWKLLFDRYLIRLLVIDHSIRNAEVLVQTQLIEQTLAMQSFLAIFNQ